MIATVTARRLFGFSFATWRFHLRGEAIRSAHDIGWIRNLTVGRLMRRDVRTVRADTAAGGLPAPVPARLDGPRGGASTKPSRYAGIVLLPEAHARELDDKVGETAGWTPCCATRTVLCCRRRTSRRRRECFERAEADALAVVDGTASRRVLGLLTEQHALRRYAEELELRRRELAGES